MLFFIFSQYSQYHHIGYAHVTNFRRTDCQNCLCICSSFSRFKFLATVTAVKVSKRSRPPTACMHSRFVACQHHPLVSKLFLVVGTSRFGQLRCAHKRADHPDAAQMAPRSSGACGHASHGITPAILKTRVERRERPRNDGLRRQTATRFFTGGLTKDIV